MAQTGQLSGGRCCDSVGLATLDRSIFTIPIWKQLPKHNPAAQTQVRARVPRQCHGTACEVGTLTERHFFGKQPATVLLSGSPEPGRPPGRGPLRELPPGLGCAGPTEGFPRARGSLPVSLPQFCALPSSSA